MIAGRLRGWQTNLGRRAIVSVPLLIWYRTIRESNTIPANIIETVAAAFNESLADVIRRTVSWTLERGAVGM
jgi:hypothetical protein